LCVMATDIVLMDLEGAEGVDHQALVRGVALPACERPS